MLELQADYSVLTQYNQQVRDVLDRFRSTYRGLASRFPKLKIQLNYSAMKADSEIHINLDLKGNEIVSKIQSMFDEAEVEFRFLGARELLALAREQPNQSFWLKFSKSLPGDNGYVVLSTLSDFNSFLRNGGEEVRNDLFDSNVRDYQGTTEVNGEISRTLTGGTEIDFWWLNNGVTVLSRLRTHNQKRTVAARAIAERKTIGHLS